MKTEAIDHDFQPNLKVTPVGILLPKSDELFVYDVTSKVTSNCLVDRIEEWWLEQHWNGSLLDELQVALDFIESMTWRGVHPVVMAATKLYRGAGRAGSGAPTATRRPGATRR